MSQFISKEAASTLRIGSLCTGYGGLDLAVEAYFNAETIWCAEFDKYASQVVQERFGIPNHGNIKEIDWATLPEIDILTAGYPCQPFSHAGQRKGTDDPRHIYPYIKEAISILRPRVVILENVRGHLSLGFKEVLKDLAEIGYDARWQVVRASDVGAPHRRERIFIIATPQCSYPNSQRCTLESDNCRAFGHQGQSQSEFGQLEQEIITDPDSRSCEESRRDYRGIHGTSISEFNGSDRNEYRSSSSPTWNSDDGNFGSFEQVSRGSSTQPRGTSETSIDTSIELQPHHGKMQKLGKRFTSRCDMHFQDEPNPLDQDDKLNAKFVEYMMGLPNGWVTDLDLSRAQQLKILGNGVVPQQAYYAIQYLCTPVDNYVE